MTTVASRPTYAEWFKTSAVDTQHSSTQLGWQNVIVHTARLIPPPDYNSGPEGYDDTLAVMLSGSTHIHARVHTETVKTFSTLLVPGSLDLIPREYLFESKWNHQVTAVFITYARAAVAQVGEAVLRGDPARHTLRLSVNFQDPLLFQLALALRNELLNGGLHTPLFAESVANTMILYLLRHYSTSTPIAQRVLGSLNERQRRHVEDYIHAHLHENIRIEALAQLVHLSVPHFGRMFRSTYGIPPYKFVILQRIERAKILLANPRQTLNEVAHLCGFANQSHFSRHFKTVIGIAPGEYAHHYRQISSK